MACLYDYFYIISVEPHHPFFAKATKDKLCGSTFETEKTRIPRLYIFLFFTDLGLLITDHFTL
jgi:hypothetical protein